jgi:uncharacterized membrane protein YebE (DUF533 family)
MKLTKTLTATALALGALVSTGAFAQPYGGPRADRNAALEQMDARNMARIERGERRGQLTPRESARLRDRQAMIERMEADARADGRVSRDEFARIQTAQQDLSRAIERRRHNDQARY